ncbi:hypothetical protein RUX70_004101 [Vibrio vulnificus]|uniref:hypothetical protein n=1 Tax=Vibrio vulnificus TaxID=672 RepID=UPI00102CF559|nr:hypothetical protein [Vibrio vulnificus]EHZ7124178.1 hypothetical protein [Vibrio vulnificus]EIO4107273.1 hypothetical protein [Vibrio vulnificus]EKO5192345.1 hypothetical protein [Vibrio vulnificus]ELK2038021.1 hypothetical protein [Vibrio vulnificus]ELK2283821.1 hypothetical protein [Vibrio vulnificus]
MWNDVEQLTKFVKFIPYVFISLGFVVALSGQFVKAKVEERIVFLKQDAEIALKNTAPDLDVTLGKYAPTGELVLQITAKNDIPFTSSWHIKTTNNEIVSGIQLEKPVSTPTPEQRIFLFKAVVDVSKIKNNYLELDYFYESKYSAELNQPQNLKGTITRKYFYVNGEVFPVEQFQNTIGPKSPEPQA